MSEELQDIFSELAIKGWGEDVDKIIQELERLNSIIKTKDEGIKAFTKDLCETTEELDIYKSIIKEAKEYVKTLECESEEPYDISEFARNELLEILDKVGEE